MRRTCLNCVMKHLGEAAVYQEELPVYPNFLLRMIGSLSHAEMEAMELYPELAKEIRGYRLQVQESEIPYKVDIPFDTWSGHITTLKEIENLPLPGSAPEGEKEPG